MVINNSQMDLFEERMFRYHERLAKLTQFAADARAALAQKDKLAFEVSMLRLYVCAEEFVFFSKNDGTPHGRAKSAADMAFYVTPAVFADEPIEDLGAGYEYPTQIADKRVYGAIRKRADDRCERCGRIGAYVAHHLHYRTKSRERPEDLLLVCEKCHDALHNALFTPAHRIGDPERATRIRERDNPVPFVVLE
jgi:hypothetical protein